MAIAAAAGRTNNPNGRPSNATLVARNESLRDYNELLRLEVRQLLDEVGRLGVELVASASRIDLALTADRPDVALHVAGRLDDLGQACLRRSDRGA